MTKTVPLSVRISQEDADFINHLHIDGAVTPSDKVRRLIKEARLKHQQVMSYEELFTQTQLAMQLLSQQIKRLEFETGQHSVMVQMFQDWMVESYAYLASVKNKIKEPGFSLLDYEKNIVQRVFRLFEFTARLRITTQAPCYQPLIIHEQFEQVFELTSIINQLIDQEKQQ